LGQKGVLGGNKGGWGYLKILKSKKTTTDGGGEKKREMDYGSISI